MHWPIGRGKAENQAAWPVLIFRIILNDLTVGNCFSKFLDADVADKTLVNRVTGELKLPLQDFLENFLRGTPLLSKVVAMRACSTLPGPISAREFL